nr:DEAD/DEAH box helicase [Anaerolineae bacterium]
MALYPYQQKVKELLHAGRSVVLQAPTGAGKTRAALAPFIEAFFDLPPHAFPKQCLYAVPMRVLASQFESEYRRLAESYERRFRRHLDVRIQTGERADDPTLMGDLVFATLDQVLSSALGVPYSLPRGQANVNVGAVLDSYLVFDEFHLFPHEASVATLQLLRLLGQWVPFIMMTATFSKTMLEEIAHLLGAKPLLVSPDEVEQIETHWGERPRKERRFHTVRDIINANAVLAVHDQRSLAVCNTVDRALALYEDLVDAGCRPVPVTHPDLVPIYDRLREAGSPEEHRRLLDEAVACLRERMAESPEDTNWVMLLHSRFERPHRQVKEAFLRAKCGPQDEKRGQTWQVPHLIVVATQVVEVGLDITSQVLHTEVAPAASVIQRAGRCARYPGEEGEVYIYQVPERKDGRPNYAPYASSKAEITICERSWEALSERSGEIVRFAQEQEIVNEAHAEADRATLQAMQEDQGRIWALITDALVFGEASARPELIRKVDSRTVIVYEPPDELSEESPFRYEGFSLWHGTLRGAVEELLEQAESLGLPWALRYPVQQQDEEDSRAPVTYRWMDVRDQDDVSASLLFAIHPALVAYDAERGFRLGVESDGSYRSPEARRRRGDKGEYAYALESYAQHIANMRRVFERRFRHRLAWVMSRLEAQKADWHHLPPGLLERAVRLALALHDVGKLEERWQRWAARYQERIGEGRPPFLVAHTHWEPHNPIHCQARQAARGKPKTHAGEGAIASARILWEALDGREHRGLYRAVVTAIARHHSPSLREANPFRLHPQAQAAVAEALTAVGDGSWEGWARWLIPEQETPNLEKRLLSPPPEEPWAAWLLYFTIARILRLCDRLSQEEE